jgi:hypothetical protein
VLLPEGQLPKRLQVLAAVPVQLAFQDVEQMLRRLALN